VQRISQLAPLLALAAAAAFASSAGATVDSAQACNLRGSWVASNAEANRYMQALSPSTSAITLTRGSLVATFSRNTFTFGGIGLELAGRRGQTKLEEQVDISAVAPYRVVGSRIALGRGSYKLRYVRVVLILAGGVSTPVRLPNQATATPPQTLAYTCAGRTLRLHVPTPSGGTVTISLQAERR
jgi:hypothetical protein